MYLLDIVIYDQDLEDTQIQNKGSKDDKHESIYTHIS